MELTPRRLEENDGPDDGSVATRRRSPRRRWLPLVVVGVVVMALGVLVVKGLSEATLYFRNADEAVAQRDELGDRRFRLQGTVVDDAVVTEGGVTFDVAYNDVEVAVHHVGDPPDLFEPGVPVVLEGRWDESGAFFASDRMLVKHDAEYESREDYDERISEADDGGEG
ncbi:MAG: cytochrome c maturation protein CcmE [Acidimicrobiales bacterium]